MQNVDEASYKVSVFIPTSGRYEYLAIAMYSFNNFVKYPFSQKIIINDCPDEQFKEKLQKLADYFGFTVIHHENKSGFAGAYHTAFKNVDHESEYCFIMEDDFIFNERVNINQLVGLLQTNPHLCQVAFKRQAWNQSEKLAGGIVEQDPDNFHDKSGEYKGEPYHWCEHRKFFTTNPSLVPAWVIEKGWPLVDHSEGHFSIDLFKDAAIHSAYLGHKFDPPKVNHIGETRNGTGY